MSETLSDAIPRLAALASQVLRWRPAEFWSATPMELSVSLGPIEPSDAPLSRNEIDAMMERDSNG
ncbi:phage tail assembly chaperone [Parerythrobacter jejuensis]|uniref:Phage tail assembly chaperone n=1 Tax=Parerythrobacter jejuensis TaxID=795812 RepID=A0A845ARM1_9SPHN|nr:phage tail assembly chaperone [Parerythrobacter jejuensis]MXP30762.1 phage tail assembly chaperone [Parerythrobacter jejuensis]MXP33522.1 phage tail assembly chaperone [Parerythrobacter jejuensis]